LNCPAGKNSPFTCAYACVDCPYGTFSAVAGVFLLFSFLLLCLCSSFLLFLLVPLCLFDSSVCGTSSDLFFFSFPSFPIQALSTALVALLASMPIRLVAPRATLANPELLPRLLAGPSALLARLELTILRRLKPLASLALLVKPRLVVRLNAMSVFLLSLAPILANPTLVDTAAPASTMDRLTLARAAMAAPVRNAKLARRVLLVAAVTAKTPKAI
jgi:hypothetical protein